jgi:hypothetical protein
LPEFEGLLNGLLKSILIKLRIHAMAELLFELGIEEIPAHSIEPAASHLGLSLTQGLERYRIYA